MNQPAELPLDPTSDNTTKVNISSATLQDLNYPVKKGKYSGFTKTH